MTRERQETASTESANLSRKALEVQEQHLEPRPARGAGHVLFCTAPSRGPVERLWFGALFFAPVANFIRHFDFMLRYTGPCQNSHAIAEPNTRLLTTSLSPPQGSLSLVPSAGRRESCRHPFRACIRFRTRSPR